MAIAAKRFSFLDNETNVGVADFGSIFDTDPRNIDPPEVSDIMSQLDGFLKQTNVDGVSSALGKAMDASMGVSRNTRDFFSGNIDLSQATRSGLDSLSKALFGGNDELSTVARQMAKKCQDYMLSGLGSRKKTKKLLDCGNSKRHDRGTPCDLNLFGQLLSKIGGVDFSIRTIDLDNLEKLLAGIGVQGYGIGLCNIWGALTNKTTDIGLLGRVAGTVLGRVSENYDMMAVRDIGRSLQDGVNVTAAVPGITSKIMSGFKIPSEITDSQLPGFGDSFDMYMSRIDPNWNRSADGLPSIENFSTGTMESANRMIRAMSLDKSVSSDSIASLTDEVVDYGDNDFLYAAGDFGVGDAGSNIADEFASFW